MEDKYIPRHMEEPVVGLDYEKEYERKCNEFDALSEELRRVLVMKDEEIEKITYKLKEDYESRIRKLEEDLKYRDDIIKSVLHIK